MSPNQREVLSAVSTITGQQEYLTSTGGALNTTGGGSGGGSTQYTSGGTAVTNPIGNSLIYFNGSNIPVAVTTANPLPITGTISVGATTDESAFTAGTSTLSPAGGVFNDSVASLTSGQQGTVRLTATRAMHMNLRNNTGTEIGTSSTPIRTDPTGTTTQPVSLTSTTITGTVAVTESGTWNVGASSATGSAVPANAFYIGINSASGLLMGPSSASLATDGNSGNSIMTGQGYTYNGTTYDRIRSATVATATTGTGVPASGVLGFDGTNYQRLATNTTGNLILGASTNVLGHVITDAGSVTNATLSAETTKVIGVVRNADGSGNLLTSTSNALDVNIKSGSISNTSFIATQATGSNLHVVVDSGSITPSTPALPGTLINGQKAVTSTASALASNALTQGVIVEALSTNTGSVFLGGTGVTATTGIELLPGGSTSFAVNNTNLIFAITATGSATVTFAGS